MSEKRINSILRELDSIVPERDKHNLLEARASHVITSAVNLLQMIRENFSEEEADDLHKRLLLSIRNEDPNKFSRKVRQLKEAHNKEKK
jgi:protoporphyrinogen oxidase